MVKQLIYGEATIMMYVYAIACIKDNDNLVGLRLLDFDSRQVSAIATSKIVECINNGKLSIQNVGVANNKLVGTNGSLDRYPVINTQGKLIGTNSPLIVLNRIQDIGYTVSDYKGTVKKPLNMDITKYVEKCGIANGKLNFRDGKCFISAISDTYLQAEDMQLMHYGQLDKNDIVLLKSLFNQSLHDAVMKKDVNKIEKIIQEDYQGEYYEATILDIEYVYKNHKKELKSDLSWAM